jgi:hypothetical protein
MTRSATTAIAARVMFLAGLFALNTALTPPSAAAEQGRWGHCVLWSSGGQDPIFYCICTEGPPFHCFTTGTSCHAMFPEQCPNEPPAP